MIKMKSEDQKILQLDRLIDVLEARLSYGREIFYDVSSKRIEYLSAFRQKLSPKSESPATNYRVDVDDGVRSRERGGETEYHTSYGWFTDEQIENLQNSRYFND
jgi:hypothetical protein